MSIQLIQGDITKQNVDAIVNEAIHKASGKQILGKYYYYKTFIKH